MWSAVNLLHIFRTPFRKNNSRRVLLYKNGRRGRDSFSLATSIMETLSLLKDKVQKKRAFLRCHDPKDWSMEALDNACVYVCVCGYRSSCQRCSVRKSVPAILLRKRLWHRCFPVNFATFLTTTFHKEHLWWLLLWVWRIFYIDFTCFFKIAKWIISRLSVSITLHKI